MAEETNPELLATSGLFGREGGEAVFSGDWIDNVLRAVNDVAVEINQKLAQTDLRSKELMQSIGAPYPKVNNGVYSFTVTMAKYGDYIDEGVRGNTSEYAGIRHGRLGFKAGKKPPQKVFTDRYGLEEGRKAAAIVFYKGIKPRHFFSDVWTDARVEQLNQEVAEATAGQILGAIKKNF
jgi:hypothetical protein